MRRALPDLDRLKRYETVATALALHSDRAIRRLVDDAPTAGTGIGGSHSVLEIEGSPVFLKRVLLTELERRPEHTMSTANLFDLPLGCQYGVGSPSFGVWREVAAHAMTTAWVLAGRFACFPLMYHWRVVDGPSSEPLVDELADIERAVGHWHGSGGVRRRVEAIRDATAAVALFLEFLPVTVPSWLAEQARRGRPELGAALTLVERCMRREVPAMTESGLFHFDAHLDNLLTDGERVYFGDLGLATSPRFDLSPDEFTFLDVNRTHDAAHTITRLVDWIVTNVVGVPDWMERDAAIRRWAAGDTVPVEPPAAASIVDRYAPVAAIVNDFYRKLHVEDRRTPYPAAAVEQALAALVPPGR